MISIFVYIELYLFIIVLFGLCSYIVLENMIFIIDLNLLVYVGKVYRVSLVWLRIFVACILRGIFDVFLLVFYVDCDFLIVFLIYFIVGIFNWGYFIFNVITVKK